MTIRVRIANLPFEAEETTARKLLAAYPGVRSILAVGDEWHGERERVCFVELREQSIGERLVRELDGRYCRGRLLAVDIVDRMYRLRGEEALAKVVRAVA